jgi:hypothetical protein
VNLLYGVWLKSTNPQISRKVKRGDSRAEEKNEVGNTSEKKNRTERLPSCQPSDANQAPHF